MNSLDSVGFIKNEVGLVLGVLVPDTRLGGLPVVLGKDCIDRLSCHACMHATTTMLSQGMHGLNVVHSLFTTDVETVFRPFPPTVLRKRKRQDTIDRTTPQRQNAIKHRGSHGALT